MAMLVVKIDEDVPVQPVRSQQYEDDEIGNEQRHVERIGVVEAAEGLIQKLRADKMYDAARGQPEHQYGSTR